MRRYDGTFPFVARRISAQRVCNVLHMRRTRGGKFFQSPVIFRFHGNLDWMVGWLGKVD